MTYHPIPHGAEWLPADYMDEIVPPCRAAPGDWIIARPGGGWALSGGWGDDDDRELTEGEIVAFYARVDLASPTLTIAFDGDGGRIWHVNPPGPWTAPPGFSLTVYDGESIWPGIDEAAYELGEGEHQLEVYAWTDTARRFRFTEGRFEPVREDG